MNLKIQRADRAIEQLQIRVNQNSPTDKFQLSDIIVDLLDYPDSVQAGKHKNASKIGNFDFSKFRQALENYLQKDKKAIESNMICPCCGNFIQKQSIPYCTPLSQIHFGLGTRLYLNSLLYAALIFFVAFCLFSAYAMIENLLACRDQISNFYDCGIQGLSLQFQMHKTEKYSDFLITSSILGVVLVSIWGVIEIIRSHHQKKIRVNQTKIFAQASQFTLMLQNFPASKLKKSYRENLEEIQRLFTQYQKKLNSQTQYKVAKYNVASHLYTEYKQNKERIQQLNRQLKQKQQIFKQWLIERKSYNQFLTAEPQREQVYDDYLDFYINKFDTQENYFGNQDKIQDAILFVTFEYSKAMRQILVHARNPHLFNAWNICHQNLFPLPEVKIKKAPPPQQIKWKNVGFPFRSKIKRIMLVYGVALLFLGGSLGATYLLNLIQNRNIWISICISVAIGVMNLGIEFAIIMLSKYLNEIKESDIQFNIAFKIGLFQSLNIIGVPLLALYISGKNLYGIKGVHQDIFVISIFNMLSPAIRLIDPYYLFIRIRNKIYSLPAFKLRLFTSQQSFNLIYQDNEFDLGYEYAYLLKTSFFTSFFLPLHPIIAIFAVFGLLLMFFVNKFRLIHRFNRPKYYSATVNTLVSNLLNLSPMLFALGMLSFINWQKQTNFTGNYLLNWIIFMIGGFFFLFPFRLLYKCIPEPSYPQLQYSKSKVLLPSEYDRLNPVTKSKALDEHISYLKELDHKKELPQQAQLINTNYLNDSALNLKKSRMIDPQNLQFARKNPSQIRGSRQAKGQKLQYSKIYPSPSKNQHKPSYNQSMDTYHQFLNIHGKARSQL